MSTMENQSRHLTVILPNNYEVNLTVGLKDRGQDVLNQLSDLLGIKELEFFGLSVVKDNQPLFLDLEQKLYMYLPKCWRKNTLNVKSTRNKGCAKISTDKEIVVLYLKVQYFVENAQLILNYKTQELYYAEVKGRVLISRCYEQEGLYFQLAAYALQADLGDCVEGQSAYFKPQDFFPFWIIQKHGNDYILEHSPALHREITGMTSSEAALLFIQEAFTLSDVPITSYRMLKAKREQGGGVLLGLASTGLQVFEMLNGEQQFLYDLAWSNIHSITFQGRNFEIRADGLHGKKLVLYTYSVMHAKHLLQHISNSHRLHLTMRNKEKIERRPHREVYITDGSDTVIEESDDELPLMKFHLANARKQTIGAFSFQNFEEQECRHVLKGTDVANTTYDLEMSVDESDEMFVDDPEVVLHVLELLEGVSVDGPLFTQMSHWKDVIEKHQHFL
ncbi:FERM domain-containing protein 6-like [Myxocyprinus asiaticus]|uniref:FERM domain-containing protein 6-like n=1 Tax=Myxocyprinus asiaticus TaxID=70543 RepID=UPI002221A138|nr:FERM domain-containing protein 6-like [Myxocyprinus asiaticus]